MTRLRISRCLLTLGGTAGLAISCAAFADSPQSKSPKTPAATTTPVVRGDLVVLQALLANPVTAPYRISTSLRNSQVVLTGAVGTKQIHDIALQAAMATNFPIVDNLTIDTAEAHRVAAWGASAPAAVGPALAPSLGASPYIYPQPLFGRLDDPFFGFEPPLLSYPPWWRAVAARGAVGAPMPANVGPVQGPASVPVVDPYGLSAAPGAGAPSMPRGAVDMTIDARGVAVLRGTVPSLADRIAIGQQLAQTPGVAQVINLLTVGQRVSETPPPPPQPVVPQAVRAPAAPRPAPNPAAAAAAPIAVDREDLSERLTAALAHRPALAGLPIKVATRDGVAFLSGRVPTVYEAMLAFRAVQQTPGVREIDDRLEFVVPDGERKNPLLQKGRAEDVEPYLMAQLRRELGDLAHVDQVHLRGNDLELHGTLRKGDDRPRLDAILRSMPVLRGFRVDPVLTSE